MNIENVTVFGAGKMGSRIAFHTAFHGYRVVVFDVNKQAIEEATERIRMLSANYMQNVGATELEVGKAFGNITYSVTLSEAISNADLVIEAIEGNAAIRKNFYMQLAGTAPQHTIFAAAYATTPPAELAELSGRPERFLAFHFLPDIEQSEEMKITVFKDTDAETFFSATAFIEDLGLAVLPVDVAG